MYIYSRNEEHLRQLSDIYILFLKQDQTAGKHCPLQISRFKYWDEYYIFVCTVCDHNLRLYRGGPLGRKRPFIFFATREKYCEKSQLRETVHILSFEKLLRDAPEKTGKFKPIMLLYTIQFRGTKRNLICFA